MEGFCFGNSAAEENAHKRITWSDKLKTMSQENKHKELCYGEMEEELLRLANPLD